MNKRTIMILAVVSAVLLLTFVVFAGTPENLGYEKFKEVLKNSDEGDFDKGNVSFDVVVTDNGNTVVNVEGTVNGDEESKEMSGEFKITAGTLEKELEIYGMEDMIYVHDVQTGDVYAGTDSNDEFAHDYERGHDYEANEEFTEKSEAVMDYFVGDLAKEFKLIEDTDGTTDIEFELTKSEVPAILNLLVSMEPEMDHDEDIQWEHNSELDKYPLFKEISEADINLTELVDEVELEYLRVVFDLNGNSEVKGVSIEVRVYGLDENSEEHVISIKADVEMLEGDVEINKIDLDSKNIIYVEDNM